MLPCITFNRQCDDVDTFRPRKGGKEIGAWPFWRKFNLRIGMRPSILFGERKEGTEFSLSYSCHSLALRCFRGFRSYRLEHRGLLLAWLWTQSLGTGQSLHSLRLTLSELFIPTTWSFEALRGNRKLRKPQMGPKGEPGSSPEAPRSSSGTPHKGVIGVP